ncbi:MAG: hypothetical protein PHY48_17620 [Candidatus Cloacimonetes bacterium]|nr:hypothetical protein [Candidatus Cloacimonadota bacterium]
MSKQENIYYPHAKYYNTENGYNVYSYNNLGLPGLDVDVSDTSKNIVVLGNSFVESRAMPPKSISTSVAMTFLRLIDPSYQVINLGKGGQIPELGFYRMRYWEKIVPPYKVVLILEGHMLGNMSKYGKGINISFTGSDFKSGGIKQEMIRCLSWSSYLNCIRVGVKYGRKEVYLDNKDVAMLGYKKMNQTDSADNLKPDIVQVMALLTRDLEIFHTRYQEKFMVLSLLDAQYNKPVMDFCSSKGIPYWSDSSIRHRPSLHLGKGHFNSIGNRELGLMINRFVLNTERR